MKINIFYLIVGILCVLFAFTHTWNGLENSLQILNSSGIDDGTRTAFTYVWHIIGIENLVFGIALIIMAFIKNRDNVKFTAWVIIAVLIMRLIIISIFTFMNGESGIIDLLVDSIAMIVVIVLLFFGTRMKNKPIIKK
jgi:O-antigen/teichoic acid export membrane protein